MTRPSSKEPIASRTATFSNNPFGFQVGEAFAVDLDHEDPLKHFREKFIIPSRDGIEQVYFLGNSLGLQPKSTAAAIEKVMKQWADYGVEGFFHGEEPWMKFHDKLRQPLADIVGAKPAEVVAMNQLTINLHLMMVSFYKPSGKRRKIICEAKAFPSDQYMLETHIRFLGMDPAEIIIEVSPDAGSNIIEEDKIIQTIDQYKDELALVFWGGVNYYSGQLFDMKRITEAAHTAGALAGFDLAHAAGNVPLALHNWNVDFACWCSYKYLNSGPGAISGAYIHERFHNDSSINRFAGWWGYEPGTRFRMAKGFLPEQNAGGWQVSTPSMFLYASHEAALDIFEEAGTERIFEKSRRLAAYLHFLLNEAKQKLADPSVLEIITPPDPERHGSQVSLLVQKNGRAIFESLSSAGFFADWREPDVIRIAPVPLYNSFTEVYRFCAQLFSLLR